MENRRATRAAVAPDINTMKSTRRIATRSSPARVSPIRKSPARRSPARKSPARKSPARKPDIKRSPSPVKKKGGRVKKVDMSTSEKKIGSTTKVSLIPLSPERIRSAVSTNTVTKKSSVTTSSTRIKLSNLSEENNADIKRISNEYTERAKRDLSSPHHQLSRTPSEISRQSVHSRSINRSEIEDDDRHSDEFSDDGKNRLHKSVSRDDKYSYGSQAYSLRNTAKQLAMQEFGGSFGAFAIIILLSSLGFYLQFICTRKCCDCTWERLELLKDISTYLNLETACIYFGFTWTLFLFSAFPLGRIVRIQSDRVFTEYCFNGILSAIITLVVVYGAEYCKYPLLKMIYRNYQQLSFISIIYALVISGWCYLRSKYVPVNQWNAYAKNGHFWADFFIGREINPRWFQVIDIKLVHYRIALIATLIFNSMFAYKSLKFATLPSADANSTVHISDIVAFAYKNVKYDPLTLLLSSLLIVYVMDAIINEHHLTNSFELQGEGVGALLLLRYALFPFTTTLISKYAFEHKEKNVPLWALTAVGCIFLLGLFLKRRSNKLKYEYRLNPGSPKFASEYIYLLFAKLLSWLLNLSNLVLCRRRKTIKCL